MIPTHESKRDTKLDGFCKLLLQTNISVIGNNLFTKSITQKEKKIKIRTKERRKLLESN